MSCDICCRTIRGFFLYVIGWCIYPIAYGIGWRLYYKTKGNSKFAGWLLRESYGNIRNPGWLSANERKWCECQLKKRGIK